MGLQISLRAATMQKLLGESTDSRRSWNPTLRNVREEWSTPLCADADSIENIGDCVILDIRFKNCMY